MIKQASWPSDSYPQTLQPSHNRLLQLLTRN
jgi:hypothetical protein